MGAAPAPDEELVVTPSYPEFDEEYFEWVDVLESVAEAGDSYVFVELGAGYGRWCTRAAQAVRRRGRCRFVCAAVEAEPDHFRWLRDHFRDNGLDPSDHDLFWAAVGSTSGFVPFWIGKPSGWYGQAIASCSNGNPPGTRERRRLRARAFLGRPPATNGDGERIVWVPCVTLTDVLSPLERADLIDMDVQGAEWDVLSPSMAIMTERVRRVHIGTHSADLEARLRRLFTEHGWQNLNDYPCQTTARTPYGEISFGDGVQTWLNPALARASSTSVSTGVSSDPPPGSGA